MKNDHSFQNLPALVTRASSGIWFVIGLTYILITTRGFQVAPKLIDFSES